jgi:putative chitinase
MDINKLNGVIPKKVLDEIPLVINRFKINTPLRLAHFLSQCSHESANFSVVYENLNYSKEGLMKIFPKYFPNETIATQYARQPEKIANKVYASRMGNGNEASKEGFRYAGKGYIQITGKNNVSAFDKFVDDDILGDPSLIATKYPLLSAAWFWDANKINVVADKGSDQATLQAVRRKVNGGVIGLDHCVSEFNKYYNLLK